MRLIAISGSLRSRSSNAALLRACARVAPPDVAVTLWEGLGELPHFNPDLDAEGSEAPAAVRALRELLIAADAIVISSPEYAHGVPGSLKNMLDWLVSTGELVEKPVVLLNAAPAGGTFAQNALVETLRTMNWNVLERASRLQPFVTRKIANEVDDERVLAELRVVLETIAAELSGSTGA